ncbi:hypothetical protein ACCO45_003871 [Purpureocillium lilacinum]|uniref:Uncharacterized protein n=1 Tax=Purpureocillium lilacinum TaxID=33203 RepID=A0ACC4E4A7_PURLI
MKRARPDGSQSSPSQDAAEHQPKISRKIRACQACQNRKIKCNLEPGQDQCVRCARLGLSCIVNKSLQTLLDDENEWKKTMEAQMHSLQAALAEVQKVLNLPQSSGVPRVPSVSLDGSSFSQSPDVARAAAPRKAPVRPAAHPPDGHDEGKLGRGRGAGPGGPGHG